MKKIARTVVYFKDRLGWICEIAHIDSYGDLCIVRGFSRWWWLAKIRALIAERDERYQ